MIDTFSGCGGLSPWLILAGERLMFGFDIAAFGTWDGVLGGLYVLVIGAVFRVIRRGNPAALSMPWVSGVGLFVMLAGLAAVAAACALLPAHPPGIWAAVFAFLTVATMWEGSKHYKRA
ncbi:hypothetical protein ACFQX4_11755 [Roseomonas sp. GCM10028921]